MARKKKEPVDDQWGARDVPYRTTTRTLDDYGIYPIRGSSSRSQRVRAWIVWGSLITAISLILLTFVTSLLSINRVGALRDRITESQTVSFDTRYASLGESVVRAYFAGSPPPISLMSGAQWVEGDDTEESGAAAPPPSAAVGLNGGTGAVVENLSLLEAFDSQQALPLSMESEDEYGYFTDPRLEQLIYTGTIDGTAYRFGVSLVIPDVNDFSKLPFLVSAPTIMPGETLVDSKMRASEPSTGPESRFTEKRLSPGLVSLIGSWAQAYAQDDRDTLQRLTGDPRPNARYQGLGGFSLVGTPTVMWSYEVAPVDGDGEVNTVARVAFDVETPLSSDSSRVDQEVIGGVDTDQFRPKVIMDVLIGDYRNTQPTVIDWAPGGMWTIMSKHRNAVLVDPRAETSATTSPTRSTPRPTGTGTTGTGVPGAPSLTMPNTTRTTSSAAPTSRTAPEGSAPSGPAASPPPPRPPG